MGTEETARRAQTNGVGYSVKIDGLAPDRVASKSLASLEVGFGCAILNPKSKRAPIVRFLDKEYPHC